MRRLFQAAIAGAWMLSSGLALAAPIALTIAYQGTNYDIKKVTVSQDKGNVDRDMYCDKGFCVVAFPIESGIRTIVSVRYSTNQEHRYAKLKACSNQFVAPSLSDTYLVELSDNGCKLVDQTMMSATGNLAGEGGKPLVSTAPAEGDKGAGSPQ